MTLSDKHVAEKIIQKIEQIKTSCVEGWIEVHVSREGKAVSISVRTTEAIKND
jgi:hypothetical protein